jgi:hypothetical protein
MDPPSSERRPGAGTVLRLIREEQATTRADLMRATGMGRSTIALRLDALLRHGLVNESDGRSTGGRPPATLRFNHRAGTILAADLGATHARVAITDLAGAVLAERTRDLDIARGPAAVLDRVEGDFLRLLEDVGRPAADVRAIGIGVPGPVEFATGQPISPPIMPGWDGYRIPERLQQRLPVPVLVDNDVNIMAVGEHWSQRRGDCDSLFIKVGTGIGCGIVARGTIYRGSQGAAGDIGHAMMLTSLSTSTGTCA